MAPRRQFSESTGAPVYIGEFSASQFAPVASNGQPSQVNWLLDSIDALEANGPSWSYFSYDTYYSWNPLLAPNTEPCGPYTYVDDGTPTSALVQNAFRLNR